MNRRETLASDSKLAYRFVHVEPWIMEAEDYTIHKSYKSSLRADNAMVGTKINLDLPTQ